MGIICFARRLNDGVLRIGEMQKLLNLMASDIAENTAEACFFKKPGFSRARIQTMRSETIRMQNTTDFSFADEIIRRCCGF